MLSLFVNRLITVAFFTAQCSAKRGYVMISPTKSSFCVYVTLVYPDHMIIYELAYRA